MNLAARAKANRPGWCQVGERVLATPPTLSKRLIGTVVDIDGFAITIKTDAAIYVAVDIEDCHPSSA